MIPVIWMSNPRCHPLTHYFRLVFPVLGVRSNFGRKSSNSIIVERDEFRCLENEPCPLSYMVGFLVIGRIDWERHLQGGGRGAELESVYMREGVL